MGVQLTEPTEIWTVNWFGTDLKSTNKTFVCTTVFAKTTEFHGASFSEFLSESQKVCDIQQQADIYVNNQL